MVTTFGLGVEISRLLALFGVKLIHLKLHYASGDNCCITVVLHSMDK